MWVDCASGRVTVDSAGVVEGLVAGWAMVMRYADLTTLTRGRFVGDLLKALALQVYLLDRLGRTDEAAAARARLDELAP